MTQVTKTLTLDILHGLVASEKYFTDGTLTLCSLTLTNGAQVVGQSNCIDPDRYEPEVGRIYARKDAVEKLWELEGYALKTRGH